MRLRHLLVPAAALLAAAPAPAPAAEPTMPLEEVRPGMRCTALSVVRGTEPVSFDAEVLDVVAGDPGARSPRILVRLSGPAVDATGIGPGFSGSPISCPGADGAPRVAGAISESVGEFGGKVALATPIGQVLAEDVEPPTGTRPAPSRARARTLRGPLTFGGVSGPVARAITTAARRSGRPLVVAPGTLRQAAGTPGAPPLRPGSAVAAGLASGDLTASSVGTVAYVDGDRVWAFGHELDAVGRRSLFLQGAVVHAVVNNPVGSAELSTYKLASPAATIGTLTNDAPDAVVGRLGTFPASFPLTVKARDLDRDRTEVLRTQVADEAGVGLPTGVSSLAQVAPVAVAQAAYTILRGSPTRQGGRLCLQVTVRERRAPMRFCNSYAGGGGPESAGAPMVADVQQAVAALDAYVLGTLRPTSVVVDLELRRGLRQAYLTEVRAPSVVRRGATARLRLVARRVGGGPVVRRTLRIRVPRDLEPGERRLTLTGTPADAGGADLGDVLELTLGGEDDDEQADDPGPRSVEAVARRVAGIARFDGVRLAFEGLPGSRRAFRDPEGLRLSGRVRVSVLVR